MTIKEIKRYTLNMLNEIDNLSLNQIKSRLSSIIEQLDEIQTMEKQKTILRDKWEHISKKELYELVYMKNKKDTEIAEIYNVLKDEVRDKRLEFNFKRNHSCDAFRQAVIDSFIKEIENDDKLSEEDKEPLIKNAKESYSMLKEVIQ